MNRRFPIATAAAVCVTFFLFWAMQALVSVQGELSDAGRSPSVDFIRLKRDTTPEEKKREKPKREKPDQPPPPPDISMSKASLNPGEGIGGIVPDIDPTGALDVGSGAGADRDVVPLGAHALQQLDAVDLRHHQIGDHQIGLFGLDQLLTFHPVGGRQHAVTTGFQHTLNGG